AHICRNLLRARRRERGGRPDILLSLEHCADVPTARRHAARDAFLSDVAVNYPRSGRAMARTGLRMMPTSPSSPLKFRTAGFPRYGFKVSMSDSAFLDSPKVKPAPGMPLRPPSLLPPFARFVLEGRPGSVSRSTQASA